MVGLVGGAAGIGLTVLALWFLRKQSDELSVLAKMDWVMLGTTLAVATTASLFAGLLPTWRACQVQPALQLKSQ